MGALLAFEKLVPVALAFGCGVFFARRRIGGADASKGFADFAFLFAVPCYLFVNIYRSDLAALFNWRAILGYALTAMVGMAVVGLATWLTVSREPRDIALRIMAGIQVNTAYFAVPVFIMLFGDAAPIFPVLLFQVCVLTLVVISIMELGGPPVGPAPVSASVPVPAQATTADRAVTAVAVPDPTVAAPAPAPRRGAAGKLLRAVWASLNTPVVLACNLGIVANLIGVGVPAPLMDGFAFVGDAASPVALFALGLHLGGTGLSIRGTTWEEIWLIAVKCVAFPLAMWLACGYLFDVRGDWLKYLVLIAAMPAPQNLFIFAQRYGVGVDMSASLVVKSSVAALLLLPLWIHWAHVVG
ncbi:AEC family transporter [Micromonospora sp. NPDC049060]|uniref:AEC family transporter n=1 Tax=unclassified Micromonospora TaxID=2617518 RepID=UPI0033F8AF44